MRQGAGYPNPIEGKRCIKKKMDMSVRLLTAAFAPFGMRAGGSCLCAARRPHSIPGRQRGIRECFRGAGASGSGGESFVRPGRAGRFKYNGAGPQAPSASSEPEPTPDREQSFVAEWETAATDQIIAVLAEGTTAEVSMHEKDAGGVWQELLSTNGYVGANGVGSASGGLNDDAGGCLSPDAGVRCSA